MLADVENFFFLNLGKKYQQHKEFAQWIQQGTKPIYIEFGSMVSLLLVLTNKLDARDLLWLSIS